MSRANLFSIACIAAMAVVVTAPIAPVTAQYAVRGGPIYGGPVYPRYGPSINVGAYVPSYYPNPPYGPAGTGFGSAYISAVPYGNNNSTFVVPATIPRNLVIPSPMPVDGVVYNPQPPPPPPTPSGPPSGPATPTPGSVGPSPTAPVPPPMAPPGGPDPAKPPTPPTQPVPNETPKQPATLAPPTDAPKTAVPPTPNDVPKSAVPPTTTDASKLVKPAANPKRTQFTVKLPADARLWVNDAETKATGASRRFHTGADLEPGKAYEYTFRAQWTVGGQAVTRDRTMRFKGGEDLTVDFDQAAAR